MAVCGVESVVAENGKPSILYEDLLRVTGDQSRALEVYLDAVDTAFPANNLDQNGEPTIGALIDTNMLKDHEEIRYEKGPGGYNQESIQDDVIDGVATQIQYAIDEIEKLMNSSRDEGERAKLEEQVRKLENDLRNVVGRETTSAVREAAKRHLDWAERLSEKDKVSVEELMQAIKMMDMWKQENTLQFVTDQQIKNNDPYVEVFKNAGGRAEEVQSKLVRKTLDRIVDLVDKYGDGYVDVDVQDLTEFEEISGTKQWVFNISHVSDDLIGHFHRTLLNAKTDQGNALTDLQQRLSDLTENADPQDLLQEDENGNKKPKLISPFTDDYYEARSSALSDYYNALEASRRQDPDVATDTVMRAKKNLYQKMNEIEELIDIRILSDEIETDRTIEEYREELIDKYGQERAEYALEKARAMLEEYHARKQERRSYLVSEVEANTHDTREGESDSEWIERKMQEFMENNSPALYIQDRQDPSEIDYVRNTGWEHTYSLPKAGEGYFNEKFENLSDSERELWDEITNTIQESLSYLPREISRGMDETFLPKVKRGFVEMMMNRGMFEAAKFGTREFIESISRAEEEGLIEAEGDQVPNPFESPAGTPPIRFLTDPNTDQRARLQDQLDEGEITQQEYQNKIEELEGQVVKDPIKATQMFYAMAINYKKMTDVSAEAEAIHRIVSESNTVSDDGKVSEGAPMRLKDSIEEEMQYLIAGNQRDPGSTSKWADMLSSENLSPREWARINRKKRELENQRDELKEQLREGEITQAEHDEKLQELDQEYKDLGGRSLVWSSLIDNTLLKFGQMKGMAINPGAALRNAAYGFIANFVHAAGGRDFDDGDVVSAMNIVFKNKARRENKVRALIDRFDILYDTADIRYGRDRDATGEYDVYFLQNETEHIAQGITMTAKMLATEIEDADGNTRNLYEAFDERGRWKEDEFGQQPEWQPSLDRDSGRRFKNFQSEVDQLNKRLHGDYSQYSKQKLKKYMLGRMVSMFRTWIPEVVSYRFGGRRKDPHLGREVVGSYRGTVEAFQQNPIGTGMQLLKSITPFTGQDIDADRLNQSQKEAIARTGREMQLWLTLAAAVMMLKPSGDEEDQAIRKIAVNNLIMLKQDVGAYFGPTRMIDLMKNPMPATRAIIDFDRAMWGTYDYLTEEDYQGKHPFWRWSATMPVISQANSIKWQQERILPE